MSQKLSSLTGTISSQTFYSQFVFFDVEPEHGKTFVVNCYEQGFFGKDFVGKYLSPQGFLNEMFLLDSFCEDLFENGYIPIFLESCKNLLYKHHKYSQELVVDGLSLPNGYSLFHYQQYGLNKAFDSVDTQKEPLFFFNFGTGTGKSIISAAGAQEMFNRDKVDLVIAFTLSKLKINLARTFNNNTNLKAVVIDGPKQTRVKKYKEGDFDVLVMNYERCHFDFEDISELVKGKRVLWISDECQKIIAGENKSNNARKAYNKLVKLSDSICWVMSATVVDNSPFNYRDTFSLNGYPIKNVLGSKKDFEGKYLSGKFDRTFITKRGYSFSITEYKWNDHALSRIPSIVADMTMSVRKKDKPVAQMFKDMDVVTIPIQMSKEDHKLYEFVESMMKADSLLDKAVTQHIRCLRLICNTPEVLKYAQDEISLKVLEEFPEKYFTSKNSSKMELFLDQVESIANAGEKVIVFTKFTKLSLFTISEQLKKRKIKHVTHYGAGQSSKESQKAQDDFKNDPEITVFLSSDAGAHGLNFQEARHVIHYDVPYSYDILVQRNDRINRADSYLDGQTAYVYVTEKTIESNIWRKNKKRKELAEKTQGVVEHVKHELLDDEDLFGGFDDYDEIDYILDQYGDTE